MSDRHLAASLYGIRGHGKELANPPHPRPIEEQGKKPAEHSPLYAGWGINLVSLIYLPG